MPDRKAKADTTKAPAAKAAAPQAKATAAASKPELPVTAKPAAPKPAAKAPTAAAKPAAPAAPAARTNAANGSAASPAATKAAIATPTNIIEGTKTMTNETIERVQAAQMVTTERFQAAQRETAERLQATQTVAAERFQSAIGDVNERAKTAMEKGAKLVEEMSDLTRGNVEALVASSRVAARGAETLGREVADYSRRSFEEVSATLKGFSEVRSATDFFKLQSDYARSAFDSMISESSKMSETVLKLAGEVAEPITSRYSVTAERVKNVAL